MTLITRIFADSKTSHYNPCQSVSSVSSVFYEFL